MAFGSSTAGGGRPHREAETISGDELASQPPTWPAVGGDGRVVVYAADQTVWRYRGTRRSALARFDGRVLVVAVRGGNVAVHLDSDIVEIRSLLDGSLRSSIRVGHGARVAGLTRDRFVTVDEGGISFYDLTSGALARRSAVRVTGSLVGSFGYGYRAQSGDGVWDNGVAYLHGGHVWIADDEGRPTVIARTHGDELVGPWADCRWVAWAENGTGRGVLRAIQR